MIYRMKRNGAGLASICILSTMVLVMLSSTACMYIGGDDSIKAANPKEIETLVYMRDTDRPTFHTVVEGVQDQSKEACRAAGVTEKNLASCRMCSFYAMKGDESLIPVYGDAYDKDLVLTYILPLEDYNFSNGVQKHLKPGEAMIYDGQNTMKGGQFAIGDQFQYQITEKLEDMIIKENRIFGVNELYIVVPTMEEVYEIYDYLNSLNVPGQDQMLINLSYWYGFDTGANEQIDESLSEQINRLLQGDITDPNAYAGLDAIFKEANVNPKYETLSMQTSATSRAKKEFYELYGGFFFLGIILSLTFLLATVLIMYYKQITEGYDDKDRFDILQKVGMTEREVKKSINSQVLTVFFAPLIMAGLHIAFAFHMISLMLSVFSISNTVLLIQVTVAAFLLFTAFYVVVYLGTSKIYYRLVSGGGGYKRKGPLAH